MRYVFIVNPTAGKKNPYEWYFPQVEEFLRGQGVAYRVCLTQYPRHATEIARDEASAGDAVRLIAVGGDGTLVEVANGAAGFANAEIGVLPCGSGNDYLRSFGEKEAFLDYTYLLSARSVEVDMISCPLMKALNICSVGLDASVALHMTRYKTLPGISGSMAYNIALVREFLGKLGFELEITIDGGPPIEGNFLFAVAGNGRCYGGGYFATPMAVTDDGLLDFVMIRVPKNKLRIPFLISKYKSGAFVNAPQFRNLLVYARGRTMRVRAKKSAVVNCDGECARVEDISFTVLPKAVRFLLPAACASAVAAHKEKTAKL